MRAFIFSLDAFVAFTLALVAIYSLIFFSSVPSAYFYLLTQGHYLTRDSLLALSLTECSGSPCKSPGSSMLDNIVIESNPGSDIDPANLVKDTVGKMIPSQFGYAFEISGDGGNTWNLVYDTTTAHDNSHITSVNRKFAVSTQIINFGYSGNVGKLMSSPYLYLSCRGEGQQEGGTQGSITGKGNSTKTNLGIITCGVIQITNNDGTVSEVPFGNVPPDQLGGGALVPATEVKLVKLTVYI